MKPHKHAELIKAWADGAEVEERAWIKNEWSTWRTTRTPTWNGTALRYEYRIKPKPDVKIGYFIDKDKTTWAAGGQCYANLYLTFDGETGELKLAEVLK